MANERALFAPLAGFFSPGEPDSELLKQFVCDDCVAPMALLEGEKIPLAEGELLRCLYRCARCRGELSFVVQIHPDGRVSFREWSAASGKSLGN